MDVNLKTFVLIGNSSFSWMNLQIFRNYGTYLFTFLNSSEAFRAYEKVCEILELGIISKKLPCKVSHSFEKFQELLGWFSYFWEVLEC